MVIFLARILARIASRSLRPTVREPWVYTSFTYSSVMVEPPCTVAPDVRSAQAARTTPLTDMGPSWKKP